VEVREAKTLELATVTKQLESLRGVNVKKVSSQNYEAKMFHRYKVCMYVYTGLSIYRYVHMYACMYVCCDSALW
jgi:hypothetical protein